MRIVVQKYGGSSVATVEKIRGVAERVVQARREGKSVVVVVSAMGNTTNELLALARQVHADPPRRELDMLLSVGERISMALLSTAIQALGEEAISFTGSQVGIITNDRHFDARIMDVRPFRIQDELVRGRIVIVAGYQGTSYRREITTLGRGGSDTTAVALAAALGAEACDIYSDVPGVWTADPRVVLDAQRLDTISYEEMQELARHGARVLNAQAVEFARRRQIAIYARSTFGTADHTVVKRVDGVIEAAEAHERGYGVHGVAGSKLRMVISLRANDTTPIATAALLGALGEAPLVCLQADSVQALAIVATENVPDPDALAAAVTLACGEAATVRRDLGTATAVGLGVGEAAGAATRALQALAAIEVPVFWFGTTRESLIAVVASAQVDDAVRALHASFIPASS